MALWGTTDADEAKPKWLTADQKTNVFATAQGWTQLNGKGLEEVICAIGGLSGALNASDITSVKFVQTSYAAGSRTISVDVSFNEKVVVTGTPQLVVDNANNSGAGNGDYTLDYASGTGTNKLRFTKASQTVSATDVLAIGGASPSAAAVTLNSGTIIGADADKLSAITIATATAGSTTFPTASVDTNVSSTTVGTVNTLIAKVFSAEVVAGGTGYSAGQEITIASGFGTGTAAVLTIATVTGGAVSTVTVKAAAPGVYSAIASGVAGIGQQSVSAGSGSGATFNLTLAVASLAVNAAGAGYSSAPDILLAGTGLAQQATSTLVGSAVALATTGATQVTKTVTA